MRLAVPLLVLLSFVFASSVGYYLLEPGYSWFDAVYITVITITTIGHSEAHELSELSQAWTLLVVTGGLVTGAVVLSIIVAMVVEGELRSVLGRRQLKRSIAGLSGHTIVCGFGRMGSMVARDLRGAGCDVVVIERDPGLTATVEDGGMLYVLGDAQDEAVLTAAGVERAGYLMGALGSDAENVFVTLSARQLNPDLKIIVRAALPSTRDKLLRAGATRVVCPQTMGAMRMANIVLRPAVVDFVEMAREGVDLELEQLELSANSRLVGQTLEQLALPRRAGVQVVAIRRPDGQTVYHPTSEVKLTAGQTLILIGQRGTISAVQKLQPET